MEMTLDLTWSVEQVLGVHSRMKDVFIALRTDCVGCPLSKFCTLEEVAAAYDLSLEGLLEKVSECLQEKAVPQ